MYVLDSNFNIMLAHFTNNLTLPENRSERRADTGEGEHHPQPVRLQVPGRHAAAGAPVQELRAGAGGRGQPHRGRPGRRRRGQDARQGGEERGEGERRAAAQ